MRILNVIMCLDPVGGGGSVERVYQLSKILAQNGEDCTILTTQQGWDEEYIRELGNVKVAALPYLTERFKIPLGLFGWLKHNAPSYDAIHLSMNWTIITALTYVFLRHQKLPYFFSAMGWLSIDGRSRFIKSVYRVLFTKPIVRNAKMCVAITKREISEYAGLGVDRTRIALIPNGIALEAFSTAPQRDAFRSHFSIDGRPFILFIGRLNPIKGPDLLLEAFAKVSDTFPSYQLVIAGNNYGYLEELKKLSILRGVDDKVTFLDPIFGTLKDSAYSSADLFVIPSRFDTMTIVALEAAALGTPVLLTKQCDFDELHDADGGLAVDASVSGLEYGLRSLLSEPKKLKRMGINGKRFVVSNYSWDSIYEKFITMFRQ